MSDVAIGARVRFVRGSGQATGPLLRRFLGSTGVVEHVGFDGQVLVRFFADGIDYRYRLAAAEVEPVAPAVSETALTE